MLQTNITDSPLPLALDYLERGWRVFPIHEMSGGRCSCGSACKRPGKHPRLQAGLKAATNNADEVQKWFGYWPNMNLAIATGQGSGLVVVDVDTDKGGDYAFELIEDDLPETVKQITGGGGFQLLYKLPAGVRVKSTVNIDDGQELKLSGIDIRGEGGYILAPPSNHASGGVYRWEDDYSPEDQELTEIPRAFLERFNLIKPDLPEGASVADPVECELDRNTLNEILSALETIKPEGRDEWLGVGMALHSTGAGSQAFDLWDDWSQNTAAGNYNARSQVSTWNSFNAKASARNLESLFFMAYSNGWQGYQEEPITIIDDLGLLDDKPAEFIDDSAELLESGKLVEIRPGVLASPEDEEVAELPGVVDLAPSMFERLSMDCPPVRYFHLWNGATMIKGGLAMIVGEPKIGKTELILSMALAATSGSEWLGAEFTGRPSVLWLNAEIIRPFIIERLGKYLELIPPEMHQIALSRFWSTAPDEFPSRIIPDLTSAGGQKWLAKLVEVKQPDLIVVDPLANWIRGADENKAKEIVEAVGKIRKAVGDASLVIVHHLKKGDVRKEKPDFDDIRGSGALRGLYDTGFLAYKNGENVRIKFECRHARTPDDFELVREENGRLKPLFNECKDGSVTAIPELVEVDLVERDRLEILVNILRDAGGSIASHDVHDAMMRRFRFKKRRSQQFLKLAESRGLIETVTDPNHKQRRVYILKDA